MKKSVETVERVLYEVGDKVGVNQPKVNAHHQYKDYILDGFATVEKLNRQEHILVAGLFKFQDQESWVMKIEYHADELLPYDEEKVGMAKVLEQLQALRAEVAAVRDFLRRTAEITSD